MKNLPLTLLLLVQTMSLPLVAAKLPGITHYGLDVRFALKESRVRIAATVSVRNTTGIAVSKIPFLLYRLFTVQQVYDHAGKSLSFVQGIVQLNDEPSLQAREVSVNLLAPLLPNDSTSITMVYEGFMFGYPEVMAYVKDRIDENYSLLRPDALSFPVLAESTFQSVRSASDTKFTYEVAATVPKGYTVACGGQLVNTQTNSDTTRFLFRSKVPTWRIDIGVAKFVILSDSADKLFIYHLADDSIGARHVLEASKNVIKLYGGSFGMPKSYQGYTVIEIPDGWGSQASDFYFLQSAAAFKDSNRISEVYHEIGHSWNATASASVQRCRYFDEAFASFFESFAIRSFRGEQAFDEDMEKSRALFAQWAQSDRQVFDTPIADYGKKELGRHSYTKGAWSLYILYKLVGEKNFASIIRTMLTEYSGRTIDFGGFQTLCERVAKRDLKKFFQEWIYGTESSRLLVDKVPTVEIVQRY